MFKAETHQILFLLILRLRAHWGTYNTPLDLLVVLKGFTFI